MWRLCGLFLVAILAWSCGSTGNDDRQVFEFLRFDNTGLTQQDAMRETSADVDNLQDCCEATGQQCTAYEPFTNATVNAVFRNMEAADIHLERVVIDTGPRTKFGVITRNISGVIPGGRCPSGASCVSDTDCAAAGENAEVGDCFHAETTLGAVLLFDVFDKQHIPTGTDNVRISFFASDPHRSFEARTSYVVTFADFNNCP